MPEDKPLPIILTPAKVMEEASPLVLTATLRPVAGLDRFQPAGFPEIGHVTYKAPRKDGGTIDVCIVDSPASMANHLESVCLRGPHDLELDEALTGMPYLRCVTGELENNKLALDKRELVVTSLTEGHRIASDYFLKGKIIKPSNDLGRDFKSQLMDEFRARPLKGENAYLPPDMWWNVFHHIYRYDPNALVHGVLFPKWQVKIARILTAHLEAFGAARVDRSGVKFDRLGKTTSGQSIFAVDDATASEIRATFILDIALLRSFGRAAANGSNADKGPGLSGKQKEFLVALALWKINRLLCTPFRYRSGCHLELMHLKRGEDKIEINVDLESMIKSAGFRAEDDEAPIITDIYWPPEELYREGRDGDDKSGSSVDDTGDDSDGEDS